MPKTIAIAGKGGVGKSTLSTFIIQSLSEKDVVLAIDADPNSNLPDKLGIEVEGTIGGLRNEIVEDPDMIPTGVSKHEFLASNVRMLLAETDKIDLLVMGRPEGAGCYCFTNNVLKECLSDLIPKYAYTVIDNEAGMEHISRKVLPKADILILVSDPTMMGVKTAARLSELAKEVGIEAGKTILVINNAFFDAANLVKDAEEKGFDNVFVIPHDPEISKLASESTRLDISKDSEFAKAAGKVISAL